uniref:Uncharacterized protein n=1 Tax=Anopheles darlingi TaxID=43151 RepID=A0A2M4DI47_ANODA
MSVIIFLSQFLLLSLSTVGVAYTVCKTLALVFALLVPSPCWTSFLSSETHLRLSLFLACCICFCFSLLRRARA